MSAAPVPPRRFTAVQMSSRHSPFAQLRRGTVVSAGEVVPRAFSSARRGFGLATVPNGETLPAATSDGGRTWHIDGPVLHAPAAQAAAGVGYVAVSGPRTYVAYGSSAVDVSADRGRTWWQTFLGELVLSVVARDGQLVAVVEQQADSAAQSLRSIAWVYVSVDGGRHWRYDDRLGAR